jgi:hypothetical protein
MQHPLTRLPRKLIGLVLLIAVLVIAAGAATSHLVTRAAKVAAGLQPYCIQVADGTSDYRPARSWLELSILRMWAQREGPLYMQHHAMLVVGEGLNPQLYHWSYRHSGFEEGVLNESIEGGGPVITCQPTRDFAAKLALIFPASSDSNYIRYPARETYRIPKTWQADWKGGRNATLSLAAAAPDFRPLNRPWSALLSGERDSNWLLIEWNPEWVLNLIKEEPGPNVVEETTEFGLSKSKTISQGKNGKEYIGYRYIAYADGHGGNTTVIDCGMPSEAFPKSCQHRFIQNGRHFYFRHRPEDVADWRRMQQRILELMDSFEVHDRRSEVNAE